MSENDQNPGIPGIPKGGMNIGEILANLNHNDYSFHITITSLLEVLKEKKNPDGTPFLTNEILAEKAKFVQEELSKKIKISQPPTTPPSTDIIQAPPQK